MKRRKILAAASSLAVLAALLTGCGAQPQESSVTAGVLTLRVNPDILMLCKSSDKGRQRTFKFLLNQFVNLTRLRFIFRNKRSDGAVVVRQYTTISKTLDVGS